ncbi:MAG: energy transducer TonB [Bacteroidales bacterium]|nr:energy transducer TonB [Bacteroidales bacterium]
MILCCEISSAQNDPNYTISLKNGSVLICYVEEYTLGSSLKGVTPNGSQFLINEADILRIEKISDEDLAWAQDLFETIESAQRNVGYAVAKAEAEARAKAEAEAKAKAQKTANAKNAINAFGKPGPGSANTSDSGSGQGDRIGSGTGNGNGSGSISSTSWALNGRSLVGNLPKPTYNSQETGTVVVEITVDKTGAVVAAKVISKGTTVQSSYLWAQAESAAKKAKFNADAKANALQKGTITYHFTLK